MSGNASLVAAILLMPALVALGMQLPPKPPKPDIGHVTPADHLARIRRQAAMTKAVDKTAQRALEYSRLFEESGEQRLRSGHMFEADRMVEAADALLHVAEHQQHLRTGGDQKGPPPAPSIRDHLQRAYFRIEQAGYFLSQAQDSRANSFPKWARDFYQLAVQAYERGDLAAADENTKSAEDVVKALENLAQAATPAPVPPPPPPPPDKKEPI